MSNNDDINAHDATVGRLMQELTGRYTSVKIGLLTAAGQVMVVCEPQSTGWFGSSDGPTMSYVAPTLLEALTKAYPPV